MAQLFLSSCVLLEGPSLCCRPRTTRGHFHLLMGNIRDIYCLLYLRTVIVRDLVFADKFCEYMIYETRGEFCICTCKC